MKKVKAYSMQRPLEWDLNSSSVTVYHNINIVEKESPKDFPVPTIIYEFDQEQFSRTEYLLYENKKNEAKTDYIAMMSDIDLGGM